MGLQLFRRAVVAAGVAAGLAVASSPALAAWEPTKPVEFVVPAGTGGGADQMARFIQGVVAKHNLMKQPLVVVNKSGGAGAEGFLEVKGAKGDPHKIIITLSNLFTTPLATGVPFNWKDLTPVAMLALDEFVLWVNSESAYKTAGDYINAVKGGDNGKFKMAGTGSKQEDQIITVALEKVVGKKLTYIPFKGGGDVAVQLVGKHVDSTVNNPIEAVAQWKAGSLRPLCLFDAKRSTYTDKVTATMAWSDIPTCKESGLPIDTYQMPRSIWLPGGVSADAVKFYTQLLDKVRQTQEWKDYIERTSQTDAFLTGDAWRAYVKNDAERAAEVFKREGWQAQ